jgi:hypothetical protein
MTFLLCVLGAALADPGTATLPLSDLQALQQNAQKDEAPILGGVLESVAMEGRVLDDALLVHAQVRVSVVATAGRWVAVPIAHVPDGVDIDSVPEIKDAWLARQGGDLVLLSKREGRYEFPIDLTFHARREGEGRSVRVPLAPHVTSELRTLYDADSVELRDVGEGGTIRRSEEGYAVVWRAIRQEVKTAASRPPREPVVDRASASYVSTLEGESILRVRYDLAFEGEVPFAFELAPGQTLDRVYVNGNVLAPATSFAMRPAQAGGATGTVELVIRTAGGGYTLGGEVALQMPRASWPTRTYLVEVYLPEVFGYTAAGGSLRAAEDSKPWTVEYTYAIPTPGHRTVWQQELVTMTAPTLRLAYTVDLAGAYFQTGL